MIKGSWRAVGMAILAISALTAAAALAAVSGTTHKVSGTSILEGIGCPATGSCIGTGELITNKQLNTTVGVFFGISGGKPGTVHQVSGTSVLNRVACPKTNYCIAVGYIFGANQQAVYVVIRHGKAGSVHDLGMQSVASIGCGTSSSCWVPGADLPKSGTSSIPMVVHLVDGKVAKTYTLKGSYNFSAGETGGATPACSTATRCLLAGTANFQTGPGLIFSLNNGKVTIAHRVTQTDEISELVCTSRSYCTLLGQKTSGESQNGEVAVLASGKVGKVSSVNLSLFPLACVSSKACFAFGSSYNAGHSESFVVPINRGKPGSPEKIDAFVGSATCQGTMCLGVGNTQGQYPNVEGTLFSFKG